MFCPGCGAPHAKHDRICGQCERDLTVKPETRPSFAQRNLAAQLLLARQEAALLRIPKQQLGETDRAFIERTVQARTDQLDKLAKSMTYSGIGGRA